MSSRFLFTTRSVTRLSPMLLLLLAACSSEGDKGTASPVRSQAAPLLGAPLDTGHTFAVGVCEGPLNADAGAGPVGACLTAGTRCTGTLIAPNLVLTAHHCVSGDPQYSQTATGFCDGTYAAPHPLTELNVTLDVSTVQGPPTWRSVAEVIVPPAQAPHTASESCDTDVALLVLTKSVTAAEATPVDVDVDTDIAVKPPTAVAVVGRGVIADQIVVDAAAPNFGAETTDAGALSRRILQNIPFVCAKDSLGADGGAGCIVTDYSSPPTEMFALPISYMAIGFGTASGDSGSGILDQASFTAGKPKLIGINSAGTFDSKGVPNFGLAVRASTVKKVLVDAAVHAAMVGGYPTPVWAGGTPPAPDAGPDASPGDDSGTGPVDDGGVTTTPDAGGTSSSSSSGGGGDSGGCSTSGGANDAAPFAALGGLGFVAIALQRRRRHARPAAKRGNGGKR